MVYISKSLGLDEVADYWEQVIIMNNHQRDRFARKIVSTLYNTVSGKKITFLGWAFKKDTNDTRESAAIYVADKLTDEMAKITVYDPKVKESQILSDLNYLNTRTAEENESLITVENDVYQACEETHAIAVLTEWDEFKTLDWQRIYANMQKPAFVFDGRGILDRQKLEHIGFDCFSIGK